MRQWGAPTLRGRQWRTGVPVASQWIAPLITRHPLKLRQGDGGWSEAKLSFFVVVCRSHVTGVGIYLAITRRSGKKTALPLRILIKAVSLPARKLMGSGRLLGDLLLWPWVCALEWWKPSAVCVFLREPSICSCKQSGGEKKAKIKFKKSHAWWEDLGWKLNAWSAAEIAGREKKTSLRMKVVPSDGGPAFHPDLC